MTDKNITIVHVAPPQITTGGDFVYRLKQPDKSLGKLSGVTAASITNICTDRLSLVTEADILIIQLLGDPDLLPIIMQRRRTGRPTVFEISDNFLDFQPSNPASRFYEVPENRACILQLISLSDAVQTTVPALAEQFKSYNKRIEVFENRMESVGTPDRPEVPIVIGWGGSIGHLKDISAVAPALKDWLSSKKDVVFSLMGDEKFRGLFSDLPEAMFQYNKPGSLEHYYSFVQTLHIGIAPLRDDPFNLCRSDVKFMEYASRGAVPVCSDVSTYNRTLRHAETGLLFRDTAKMIEHLDMLVEDPATRKKLARQAHEYICNERMEDAGAQDRLDFYLSLLPDNLQKGTLSKKKLRDIPSLRKSSGSSHFMHDLTNSEEHLCNGMVCHFAREDHARAAHFYNKALSLNRDYFHANFYMGGLLAGSDLKKPEIHLRRALELWPESCEARLKLSRMLGTAGNINGAMELLCEIQATHPEYAPAYIAEAELLLQQEEKQAAHDAFTNAINANPYYAPAMIQLGALALQDDNTEEAMNYFRQALEIIPRSSQAHYGLASAHTADGNPDSAADEYISALSCEPDSGFILDHFKRFYKQCYKSGDFKSVADYINRALEIFPDEPELLFWLARAYERLGDTESASIAREKLKETDSSGKYSRFNSPGKPG